MRSVVILFACLLMSNLNAQAFSGEILLRDRSSYYLNQVYVTNLNEQRTILTNFNGSFSINAKPGDIVRFTSIVTDRKDVVITEKMLQTSLNIVELKIAYYEIQEVVINKFKPSGNLKKDVLSLKTGEKEMKLKTIIGLPEPKGDGTPQQAPVLSLADGGLSFSIDTIYDLISGDHKKKQRLQNYEKMNAAINNIKQYYGEEYFLKLKIPKQFIDNFLQFVYSSDDLRPLIAAGNYEAVAIYIERYLPIYQRRLQNSKLMETVTE